MMHTHQTLHKMWSFFRYSLRLYFAPLTGTVRGIRDEYRRIEADRAAHIDAAAKAMQGHPAD
jgi:hypothetical protein